MRHSTGNVRIRIADFFQNFSYKATYVYAKRIRTHTHIHIQQETMVMTIGKICKADLPKNVLNYFDSLVELTKLKLLRSYFQD